MNDMVMGGKAQKTQVVGEVLGNFWQGLDRTGRAVILVAGLVAVSGLMLVTANQAYAGSCSAPVQMAFLDISELLPAAF